MSDARTTVHVWDMGLVHRWWHAVPTDKRGDVWARFCEHVERYSQPDAGGQSFIAIAADSDQHGWRYEKLPTYKEGRKPTEPEIKKQIEACCAKMSGWIKTAVFRTPGAEADDIIATVAWRSFQKGLGVVIHSADKDLVQLMGVAKIHDTKDWVTEGAVKAKFGVGWQQIIDYLAIVGDAVDGIKGIPGVGKTGALELLDRYGSLDGAIEGVTERAKWYTLTSLEKKVIEHADDARLSKLLVTLDKDVSLERWGAGS